MRKVTRLAYDEDENMDENTKQAQDISSMRKRRKKGRDPGYQFYEEKKKGRYPGHQFYEEGDETGTGQHLPLGRAH